MSDRKGKISATESRNVNGNKPFCFLQKKTVNRKPTSRVRGKDMPEKENLVRKMST